MAKWMKEFGSSSHKQQNKIEEILDYQGKRKNNGNINYMNVHNIFFLLLSFMNLETE